MRLESLDLQETPKPMSAPAPDPLLTAIRRLTSTHTEGTPIAGLKKRTHYAKHEPLAKQLRDSIGGDVKGGGAGGKAPNERTPIDPDAFQKYADLVSRVHDFHFEWTGFRADSDEYPETTLNSAYQAFKRAIGYKQVAAGVLESVTVMWQNQVTLIETKLSPATIRELPGFPCPNCGLSRYDFVINRNPTELVRKHAWIDSERRVALVITYRPDNQGGFTQSFGTCGCCGMVWPELLGLRELANDLERIESHAMSMWADHFDITGSELEIKAAWADLSIASRGTPYLMGREEWMQLAYADLLDTEPAPDLDEPALPGVADLSAPQ